MLLRVRTKLAAARRKSEHGLERTGVVAASLRDTAAWAVNTESVPLTLDAAARSSQQAPFRHRPCCGWSQRKYHSKVCLRATGDAIALVGCGSDLKCGLKHGSGTITGNP